MSKTQDQLREEYEAIRPQLGRISGDLEDWLKRTCEKAGIYEPRIEVRVKKTDSLLRKVFLREFERRAYADPLRNLSDKVGGRIDVVYPEQVKLLRASIDNASDVFEAVLKVDDKANSLGPRELDYVGVHFDVVPIQRHGLLRELSTCEIQLRTNAQACWAMACHGLVHKPPEGKALQEIDRRRLYRLVALMELFDEQVSQARSNLMNDPLYPIGRVIEALHEARIGIVTGDYNLDLTRAIVAQISQIEDVESADRLTEEIREFVEEHSEVLKHVMNNTPTLLGSQPEAILIFLLLERRKLGLQNRWREAGFPNEQLDDMASAWGVPLPQP